MRWNESAPAIERRIAEQNFAAGFGQEASGSRQSIEQCDFTGHLEDHRALHRANDTHRPASAFRHGDRGLDLWLAGCVSHCAKSPKARANDFMPGLIGGRAINFNKGDGETRAS